MMLQQTLTEMAVPDALQAVATPQAASMEIPAMGAERLAVMNATRLELGSLAQAVLPTAMALGTLGIMAYGIKTMFRPLTHPKSLSHTPR